MDQRSLHAGLLIVAFGGASVVFACSSGGTTSGGGSDSGTPASSTPDGATSSPSDGGTSDAGSVDGTSESSTADSGTSAGGTDPAAGKATMEATFSNSIDPYNGILTPFSGLEKESNAQVTGAGVKFATFTVNGVPLRRGLEIAVGATPVQGMTYTIANDTIKGNFARYQEQNSASSLKAWSCPGPVTFDSISGSVYKFHYTLTCTNPGIGGTGKGGVTITGTGVGRLN